MQDNGTNSLRARLRSNHLSLSLLLAVSPHQLAIDLGDLLQVVFQLVVVFNPSANLGELLLADADVPARKWLSDAVWARKLRGTCSPIWNGIGSGKALTLNSPHRWSSRHLRRILLPERSNLFQSHWSNQWLTNLSYIDPSLSVGFV